MNKHVQIRNVPEALHRRLKLKAMRQGMNLSDYLRLEMERIAKLPTLQEWAIMVKNQDSSNISTEEILESIQAGREEHDAKLERQLAPKP
jgi:antitoxin FitA